MGKDELLKQGIAAYKAGRKAEARELFFQTLELDRDDEQTWLWVSGVVDTDTERRTCLEEVLALNPNNATARRGLEHLQASAPAPAATPEPPAIPRVEPLSSREQLTPPPPIPEPQPVPPEQTVETTDKPAGRGIGFWAFAGVVVVMICLLGCIVVAILGSLGGGGGGVTATDSPATITSVVYENIAAHNAEDVARYMATLHSGAPNYDKTPDLLRLDFGHLG